MIENTQRQIRTLVPVAIASLGPKPVPSKSKNSEPSCSESKPSLPRNTPILDQFQTRNNKKLKEARDEALRFIQAVLANPYGKGYTLSLLGHPGTGKTMLARAILAALGWNPWAVLGKIQPDIRHGEMRDRTGRMIDCRQAAKFIMDGNWGYLDDAAEHRLLVLDDVGANYDKSGVVLGKIDSLLRSRGGMWTVVTSNLKIPDMAGALGQRIGSWLIRDENTAVEMPDEDYATREGV